MHTLGLYVHHIPSQWPNISALLCNFEFFIKLLSISVPDTDCKVSQEAVTSALFRCSWALGLMGSIKSFELWLPRSLLLDAGIHACSFRSLWPITSPQLPDKGSHYRAPVCKRLLEHGFTSSASDTLISYDSRDFALRGYSVIEIICNSQSQLL